MIHGRWNHVSEHIFLYMKKSCCLTSIAQAAGCFFHISSRLLKSMNLDSYSPSLPEYVQIADRLTTLPELHASTRCMQYISNQMGG